MLSNISFGQIDTSIVISKADKNLCPITVIYRVDAPSFTEPFHWTIHVTDIKGKLVFSYSIIDSLVEPMFQTKDILVGCADYRSCKKEYYFKHIPTAVLRHKIFQKTSGVFDRNSGGCIYQILPKYLEKSSGYSTAKIKEIVSEVEKMLHTEGGWVLSIPLSPAQDEFPLVYYPSLNQFVPFYEW